MIKQRDSREMALKFLFCQEFLLEQNNTSYEEKLEQFKFSFKAPNEVWGFTFAILKSYQDHRQEVDDLISQHLKGWSFNRIAVTDKSILRIALSEMLFLKTPPKVVINESIDLAKKYSTLESAAFVNGVLDSILEENAL